jgi:tetratricopeptide (TPR) repeat protein
MRHIFDTDIFSRYVDGMCTAEELKEVESHIEACSTCRNDLAVLKDSTATLRSFKKQQLPEEFYSQLEKRLDEAIQEKEEARQLRVVPVLAKVAVSVILIVALGLSTSRYFGIAAPYIRSTKGTVEIFDKSTGTWKSAVVASPIDRGDIIRTARNSEINIELADAYFVRVKENSELAVPQLTRRRIQGSALFDLRYGMMLVDVAEDFQASRFRVVTPTAKAKALATKFMVDVGAFGMGQRTWIGVLDGGVEVTSMYVPPAHELLQQSVLVKAGQKTEVFSNAVPLQPSWLLDEDWRKIEELYQIGSKPQVALLISIGSNRVTELLKPCPLYLSDRKPIAVPPAITDALLMLNQGIEKGDKAIQLAGIQLLDAAVADSPNPVYHPQLLLYIGAYYNYLGLYEKSIQVLQKVIDTYPSSGMASLAQCAIGVIYEEGLQNNEQAIAAYAAVLENYPHSPEAIKATEKLELKKAR